MTTAARITAIASTVRVQECPETNEPKPWLVPCGRLAIRSPNVPPLNRVLEQPAARQPFRPMPNPRSKSPIGSIRASFCGGVAGIS